MAKVSRLEENLSAGSTGLILFDVLNGFLHPSDVEAQNYLREHSILPNLQRLLVGARRVGMTTFYPMGAHAADGSDTVIRRTSTTQHLEPFVIKPAKPTFAKNSKEASIAPELAPDINDVVSPKHRWNAFYHTDLELHLRVRGIHTVIIAGGATEIGIASTVFAARDMDLGLVVVSDACASPRGENPYFMSRIFPRMGRVLTVEETIALMTP
jgi:ureidoacrylate peracid hydrolase